MKRLLIALIAVLGFITTAKAQDPQLSQYYAAPLYLNPAFTGNLDYECRRYPASRVRVIANYRNQARGNYTTYMSSLDYRSKNGNWGFGGLIYQDQAGQDQKMNNVQVAGLASYKLSLSNDWRLHSGLQVGYLNRSTGASGYTYPDEFTGAGRTRVTNETVLGNQSINTFDVSTGLLVFNEAFYLGAAVHHLNQPNMSLQNASEPLPTKIDIHTGYRISFTRQRGFARRGLDQSLTPTLHYKRQGQNQQLDIGTYFAYEPLILGAWFRGLPVIKAPDNSFQRDAAVLLVGVRQATDYGLVKLGLSYDFPISTGAQSFGRTFEITLSYQAINERCRKRVNYRSIPCPGI
jgi:type IX secretion system PorP/SprF family membrane protein